MGPGSVFMGTHCVRFIIITGKSETVRKELNVLFKEVIRLLRMHPSLLLQLYFILFHLT
jgi:hypothetical protein